MDNTIEINKLQDKIVRLNKLLQVITAFQIHFTNIFLIAIPLFILYLEKVKSIYTYDDWMFYSIGIGVLLYLLYNKILISTANKIVNTSEEGYKLDNNKFLEASEMQKALTRPIKAKYVPFYKIRFVIKEPL